MANKYSAEERAEALKLADEIGATTAAQRLGIKADTIYGWRGRAKKKGIILNQAGQPMSEDELRVENARLTKELKEAKEEVEILQDALGFFVKRPEEVSKSKLIDYIKQRQKRWTVAALCRVLGVSESGYYKHLRNAGRPYKYADLLAQIYELIKEDPENVNYGVRASFNI
jgi:transposase